MSKNEKENTALKEGDLVYLKGSYYPKMVINGIYKAPSGGKGREVECIFYNDNLNGFVSQDFSIEALCLIDGSSISSVEKSDLAVTDNLTPGQKAAKTKREKFEAMSPAQKAAVKKKQKEAGRKAAEVRRNRPKAKKKARKRP